MSLEVVNDMKSITSKIVNTLNENISSVNEAVEDELVVSSEVVPAQVVPAQIHQCSDCYSFYPVGEISSKSLCPQCSVESGVPWGEVKVIKESDGLVEEEDEIEVESELRAEAEVILAEALRSLDYNDFSKFNESYRPRVRMTRRGELETILESAGGSVVSVSRKMTSRQKVAYSLAEKYSRGERNSSNDNKRVNESIKAKRRALVAKNESRALKVKAVKILESMNANVNIQQFNTLMNEFIEDRDHDIYTKITEDDGVVMSDLVTSSPQEISSTVSSVIEDTGLDVVNSDVEIDGDVAVVSLKVKDSPDVEVHTDEVVDVLSYVYKEPVSVVGSSTTPDENGIVELAVVIGEEPINEDADEDEDFLIDESIGRRRSRRSRSRINESYSTNTAFWISNRDGSIGVTGSGIYDEYDVFELALSNGSKLGLSSSDVEEIRSVIDGMSLSSPSLEKLAKNWSSVHYMAPRNDLDIGIEGSNRANASPGLVKFVREFAKNNEVSNVYVNDLYDEVAPTKHTIGSFLGESYRGARTRRSAYLESVRRRRNSQRFNENARSRRKRSKGLSESFILGNTDENQVYALKLKGTADSDAKFLGNDDSLVAGSESNAEDLARIFLSSEAGQEFLDSMSLSDDYEVVPIVVSGKIDEEIESVEEDTSYFEEDGYFYKRTSDGTIKEVGESEYIANTRNEGDIIESFSRKRRRSRRIQEGLSGPAKRDIDDMKQPQYWMDELRDYARMNNIDDIFWHEIDPNDMGLQMGLDAGSFLASVMDKYNLTLEDPYEAEDGFDISENEYYNILDMIEDAQKKAFASYPNVLKALNLR